MFWLILKVIIFQIYLLFKKGMAIVLVSGIFCVFTLHTHNTSEKKRGHSSVRKNLWDKKFKKI